MQPVVFPPGAEAGTRKLTISVTPSIAGTVFAALDFLTSYPYGCTEQTMSSFLPDVLVADALQKLGVKSNIDPQTLHKQVQAGTRPAVHLSARRRRLGLVADRRQPSLHDGLRAGRTEPGEGGGLRREAGRHRQGRAWLLPQFDNSQKVRTDLRAYMAYALVLSGTRRTRRYSIPSGASARR